jgi:hypothetical protein
MDIFNIQALIREGKLITANDVDPTEAYLQVGVFQKGNRKSGASNADTYPSYALPLSELSGSSLPIARYVYLVQDASDALLMGGTASNVYTTFQTAYDAANVLQLTLGGTNTVVILVGNTTAATVGDLTLTANYNRFVLIKGINLYSSILGNIIATNNLGNGYHVGVNTSTAVTITDVTIGTISTNATGATGNSGNVSTRLNAVQLGNIDTSITNTLNTTGNGGSVTVSVNTNNFVVFGNITTSSKGPTSSAGSVTIVAASFSFNQIITANGNLNGNVTLRAIQGNFFGNRVILSSVGGLQSAFTMQNGQINQLTLSTAGSITLTEAVVGSLTVVNTSPTLTPNTLTITDSRLINNTISDLLTVITAKLSSFNSIEQVGDNSIISNCVFDGIDTSGISPTISEIGTGCSIYNCTVLQGLLGIDNSSPVTVNGFGTIFVNGIGANVTIV